MRSLSDTPHSWWKELYDRVVLALGFVGLLYAYPVLYVFYPDPFKFIFGNRGWLLSALLYIITFTISIWVII